MHTKNIGIATILSLLLILGLSPALASASTPQLSTPPANLPSVTYYTPSGSYYTVTSGEWGTFFTSVIDNRSIVSYNWTANATQDLIVFDLSYTGMNYYGLQLVLALSGIGFPSLANMTKAFWQVANQSSKVSGYTNIQALNVGAYPGFSWSTPKVHTLRQNEYYAGSIVAIIAAVFVLYYIFNRKK